MSDGTRTVSVRLVDAFADEPLAGNPAGVVRDADELVDEQMQAIARELSVSETAFLFESDEADYRIRYFTPTREVDLCGHATIGSFVSLYEAGDVDAGTTTLETDVGVLDVDVEGDGTVWMSQGAPTVREVDLAYERVAEALGVEVAALEGVGEDLPLAVASTGLPFLIVPIVYLQDVGGADPDMAAIESLADEVDATGVYLFTFDALEAESTLHGRMFAPGAGIQEDPVTGTASGATGAYLNRFGAFSGGSPETLAAGTGAGDVGVAVATDAEVPDEMRFEQGHYVDRPGFVRVRVDGEVRVGGRGVVSLDGRLVVPQVADDEILEG